MKYQELQDEVKAALKAHDKPRVSILRQVHGEVKNIEVNERREITDADVDAMLKRVIKQTKETLEGSIKAGNNQERTDLLAAQVEILESYLPKQVSGDELIALIEKTLTETGATSKKEMGKVMGALTKSDRRQLRQGRGRGRARQAPRLAQNPRDPLLRSGNSARSFRYPQGLQSGRALFCGQSACIVRDDEQNRCTQGSKKTPGGAFRFEERRPVRARGGRPSPACDGWPDERSLHHRVSIKKCAGQRVRFLERGGIRTLAADICYLRLTLPARQRG